MISPEQSSVAQTAVVSLATLAALVLLGLVLAYWTWNWVAPRPEPRVRSAAMPGGGVGSVHGLFGTMQRDRNVAAPTGISIKLLGVVAAAGGRRGYAVVQLDTREILAIREGEDVASGIRLAEVHPDHVILERGGVRESLAWPQKIAAAKSTAPPVNK